MHFDKLSANVYLVKSIKYPFLLSLSKHEWITLRGTIKSGSHENFYDELKQYLRSEGRSGE